MIGYQLETYQVSAEVISGFALCSWLSAQTVFAGLEDVHLSVLVPDYAQGGVEISFATAGLDEMMSREKTLNQVV